MKTCYLILFTTLTFQVAAQQRAWPPGQWADTSVYYGGKNLSPAQNLLGYAILKNGDSVSGYLRLVYKSAFWWHNECLILPDDKFKTILTDSKDISYIRVKAASLGRDFTEIFTLPLARPKNSFWRLIAKKDSVAVYDRSLGIFSHESRWETWKRHRTNNIAADEFNEHMVMISNGQPIKIYGTFGYYRKRDRAAELILQFINDRYQQSFKLTDFKTRMDMIDYILQAGKRKLGQ